MFRFQNRFLLAWYSGIVRSTLYTFIAYDSEFFDKIFESSCFSDHAPTDQKPGAI